MKSTESVEQREKCFLIHDKKYQAHIFNKHIINVQLCFFLRYEHHHHHICLAENVTPIF